MGPCETQKRPTDELLSISLALRVVFPSLAMLRGHEQASTPVLFGTHTGYFEYNAEHGNRS